MLRRAGHEVVLAEDGIAAWAVLQQPDAPKLAVLDWMMPGLDGLEVVQKAQVLFQAEPVYRILLTSRTDKEDIVRALDAGANDYLTKPFNWPELLARVEVGVRVVQLQSSLAGRLRELESALAARQRAEEALFQEQDCVRSLMDNLPVSIYFKDRFSRFTRINTEMARRFGLRDPGQAVGLRDYDFFTLEHAAATLAEEKRIIQTGEPLVEREERESWPDGRVTWAASTKMPLRRASGEIIGTFGVSRDITQRKESDEASRFLASIVESSDDAIVGLNLDGTIASWNHGAERLYGYAPAEVLGHSHALLIPPDRVEEMSRLFEEVGRGARIPTFETKRVAKDGSRIDVSLTVSPIKDDRENTTRAVVIARDIGASKRAEEELYQSNQKLQLILDSIPQRVFWKDRHLAYLGCNTPFAIDAGLPSAAEIRGKSDCELVWRAAAGQFQRDDQAVMDGESPKLNYDERLIQPDGTVRWLRTSKLPLRGQGGDVIGVLGTYEDITERKQAEEGLRVSESRYRQLFERNLAGVFRTSAGGKIVECNQSAARIFGYSSAEEALAVRTKDIHWSAQARIEFLEHLMAQRSLTNLELKLRRRDGSPVWVTANVIYVEPVDGEEAFVEGTVMDITDRKRAEEALAQETMIVTLRAEVGAALIAPGTLRQGLQKCTDALVARTGVASAQAWTVEYPASNLVLEASSGLYNHLNGSHGSVPLGELKIGRIALRRQPHLSNDVQNDPEVSDRDWAKREGMVSFVGHPLVVADRVVGVIAAFGRQPLTEPTLLAFSSIADQIAQFVRTKRAEEALLKSEERAMLLFATIPHAAYAFDLETLDFLEVNDLAVERYGYSREEFMHMKTTDIRPPEAAQVLRDYLREKVNSSTTCAGQWKHLTRSGCIIDVEINYHLLDYDGRRAALTIAQDVTERNKLEIGLRHAQKLEAVGGLASGIAHELNTPIQFVGDNIRFVQDSFNSLMTLLGKLQEVKCAAEAGSVAGGLLQEANQAVTDGDLPYLMEEIPKALNQSLDGVERVATIVRAMKDFAHSDQSQRAAADLNKALASTLIVARNEIKYVADIVTDFGDLPAVECCLGDLNQVFLNLLVNAAHAIESTMNITGKKGVIRIQSRHEGDHVRIAFSDTGSGIPEAIRDKVFEPFFTTKAVGRGTGQGLAISRTIVVDKHGGSLTFETEMGRGTTFWITLPVSSTAAPCPAVFDF
jgi:PAS domain S-box-containing protein